MFRSVLIASALALAACAPLVEEAAEVEEAVEDVVMEGAPAVETMGVVATATARDDLSTFASLLGAAEIGETLSGPGPFTVFAPSDAAFDALPEGTLDRFVQPENRERLRVLLGYHIVPGRLTSAEFAGQQGTAQTAIGAPLRIDATGPGIRVDDANVIAADIEAANGIIHIIDRVLVPQTPPPAAEG